MLESVLGKLTDAGKVERPPAMDGKRMTALIMPSKPVARAKPKPGSQSAAEKPVASTTPEPSA